MQSFYTWIRKPSEEKCQGQISSADNFNQTLLPHLQVEIALFLGAGRLRKAKVIDSLCSRSDCKEYLVKLVIKLPSPFIGV